MTSPFHSLNKSSISPSPYKSVLPLCLCLHVQHTVNNHNGVVVNSSVVHWRPLLVKLRQWLPSPMPQPTETEPASIHLLWVPVELKAMPWTIFAYWLIRLWKQVCVCLLNFVFVWTHHEIRRQYKWQEKHYVTSCNFRAIHFQ